MTGGEPVGALPAAFLAALDDREEVLVTSRAGSREVTVPMTCAVGASGHVYLMTSAFSRKARRWERDPWARLTVPGTEVSAEAMVTRVTADDLIPADRALILDRFTTAGAATAEALGELLRTGTHLLLRVSV